MRGRGNCKYLCEYMHRYLLSLDQGTSSSKAIVFDESGTPVAGNQKEFKQLFPRQGWVEQNPMDIWSSEQAVMKAVAAEITDGEIVAIGIANQRETTIVWDAATGRPICNAIVWQDRRTADYCKQLMDRRLGEMIRHKTGLVIDAYFSATKIKWILDNVPGAREKAEAGRLRFGTVDSWLIWNLTGASVHATDVTNASRTMLFNINSLDWDKDLLDLFGIPASMLPEVHSSSEIYGYTELAGRKVPIAGVIGDQQSALFGQMCIEEGSVKNTYGTGCFLLMNCGHKPVWSDNELITTIAWKIGDNLVYALEGSIFVAGAVVQWLRDGLGIIKSSHDIEALAASVPDNGGVYFVPTLTGMGAPYWNQNARGIITGITRGTTSGHIARAALEGIAFQTLDIVTAMEKDAGILLSELKVDGGAARNNLLMQFQADVLGTEVIRPKITELTALGAAYMAGLALGVWTSVDGLKDLWHEDRRFSRHASDSSVSAAKAAWAVAVRKALL